MNWTSAAAGQRSGRQDRCIRMSYGQDVAKVSIVGAGMQSNPGVAAAMFEALADAEINIHMISTSEIKVSCIIDEDEVNKAVQALHAKFRLSEVE